MVGGQPEPPRPDPQTVVLDSLKTDRQLTAPPARDGTPSPEQARGRRDREAEVRSDILRAYAAYGEMHVARREAPLLGHFEGAALEGLKQGVLRSLQYSSREAYTGIRVDRFDIRSATFPASDPATAVVTATAAYTLSMTVGGGCVELSSGSYRIDMHLVQR